MAVANKIDTACNGEAEDARDVSVSSFSSPVVVGSCPAVEEMVRPGLINPPKNPPGVQEVRTKTDENIWKICYVHSCN